jgi:hypothetical protein
VTSTAKVNKRPLPPLPPETASTNRSTDAHSSSRSSAAIPVALRRPVAPPPPPRPPSSAVDSEQRHSVVNQPAPVQHNSAPTLPPRGDRSSSAATVASNRFTPADISLPVTSLSESSQSQRSDSPIIGSLSSLFPSASRNDGHADSPRVVDNTTVSRQDLQHQSASSQLTSTSDVNLHFPVSLRPLANKPLPVPPLAARNSQLLPPPVPLVDSAPSSSSSSMEGRPPKPPLPNKPTVPSLLYPTTPLVSNFLSELEREVAINATTVNSDSGLVMVTDHFGNRDDSILGNSSLSLHTVVPLTGVMQRHVAHTDSAMTENIANNIDTGDRTSAAPIVVSLGDDFDEMRLSLGGRGADTQSFQLPSPQLALPPRNRLRNRPVSLCLFADVQPNAPFLNYDKSECSWFAQQIYLQIPNSYSLVVYMYILYCCLQCNRFFVLSLNAVTDNYKKITVKLHKVFIDFYLFNRLI